MSSAITKIIQIHEDEMKKNKQWAANEHSKKRKEILKLQFLGGKLLEMIIVDFLEINDVTHFDEKNLKNKRNLFLRKIQQEREILEDDFLQILGLYFQDQTKQMRKFEELSQEIQILNEDDEKEEFEIEEANENENDNDNSMIYDDKIGRDNIDANEIMKKNSLQQELESVLDQLNLEGESTHSSIRQESSFLSKNSDPHHLKVMNYLMKLTAPQTEVSYLCQQFGWNIRFYQEKDKVKDYDWFNCSCQVDMMFKKTKETIIQKHEAKSKKKGRMIASFKSLRYIYLTYPSIWDQYSLIKEQKSLSLPLDESVTHQINKEDLHHEETPVAKIELKTEKQQLEKEKRQYLKDVSSFKSELNLILQHNPNSFTLEKPLKIQNEKSMVWKVKTTLTVLIKHSSEKSIQECSEDKNSKDAEQRNAKKVVEQVYNLFPEVFIKMQMVKNKKGIKI